MITESSRIPALGVRGRVRRFRGLVLAPTAIAWCFHVANRSFVMCRNPSHTSLPRPDGVKKRIPDLPFVNSKLGPFVVTGLSLAQNVSIAKRAQMRAAQSQSRSLPHITFRVNRNEHADYC
jgi:hypothetical protein